MKIKGTQDDRSVGSVSREVRNHLAGAGYDCLQRNTRGRCSDQADARQGKFGCHDVDSDRPRDRTLWDRAPLRRMPGFPESGPQSKALNSADAIAVDSEDSGAKVGSETAAGKTAADGTARAKRGGRQRRGAAAGAGAAAGGGWRFEGRSGGGHEECNSRRGPEECNRWRRLRRARRLAPARRAQVLARTRRVQRLARTRRAQGLARARRAQRPVPRQRLRAMRAENPVPRLQVIPPARRQLRPARPEPRVLPPVRQAAGGNGNAGAGAASGGAKSGAGTERRGLRAGRSSAAVPRMRSGGPSGRATSALQRSKPSAAGVWRRRRIAWSSTRTRSCRPSGARCLPRSTWTRRVSSSSIATN